MTQTLRIALAVWFALSAISSSLDAQDRRSSRPRVYPKSAYSHNTVEIRRALQTLAAKHRSSVVSVFCEDKQVAFGVVVSKRGEFVTKASELKGSVEVVCVGSKDRVTATLIGIDDNNDLALLSVNAKTLIPAKLWANNKTRTGSVVATITQEQIPLAYGVMSVARHPRKPRPLLGVQIAKVAEGIRLSRVTRRSSADDAGLKAGDVVVAIDGKKMVEDSEFRAAIVEHKPGEKMTLQVLRDGKKIGLVAKLKTDSDRHGPISSQERSRLWGPLSDVRLGFDEVIQHDSVMTPQQCGSPIVNLSGQVVGVNIARVGRFETLALTSKIVLAAIARIRSKSK
jgi:serine protease Do